MTLPLDSLAFLQNFCPLSWESDALLTLTQAHATFGKGELTESANLFLKSWRSLQSEYERNLHTPLGPQQQRDIAQINSGIMPSSLIALYDLALVCSSNTERYRDNNGNCKLEVHIPQYGRFGDTTAETLEIDNKSWPKGSRIAHAVLLKDPLGRLLDEADSFNEAANIIARICSLRLACLSEKLNWPGYKFISDGLASMKEKEEKEMNEGKIKMKYLNVPWASAAAANKEG
jgi:hypothetical protein